MNRWPLLRRLLGEQTFLLVLVWAGYLVVVAVIGAIIAATAGLEGSIWEQASQLSRWFAAFIGVYLTGTVLRLAVAQGVTRREFLIQAGAFTVAYSFGLALLTTVAFAVETLVYRGLGLPQTFLTQHLYDSPTQYGHILVTFWLTIAVWLAAGAFVAVAFHRSGLLGLAAIPLAIVLVSPTELLAGYSTVPLLRTIADLTPAATVVPCLVSLACAAFANWAITRRIPISQQKAT